MLSQPIFDQLVIESLHSSPGEPSTDSSEEIAVRWQFAAFSGSKLINTEGEIAGSWIKIVSSWPVAIAKQSVAETASLDIDFLSLRFKTFSKLGHWFQRCS
jgi:hypothetical protein